MIYEVGMELLAGDPTIFIKIYKKENVEGCYGTHVDDCLMAGTKGFEKDSELSLQTFELKPGFMTTLNSLEKRFKQFSWKFSNITVILSQEPDIYVDGFDFYRLSSAARLVLVVADHSPRTSLHWKSSLSSCGTHI